MSMTIKVNDDITLVISDRLAGLLPVVPPKTGKHNKYRRLSVMRRNLLTAAQSLSRESRRFKPYLEISYSNIFKDLTK